MLLELKFEIVGVTPLICHNSRLSDPLNKWSKRIKVFTSKGVRKTDEDHHAMADIEWEGGSYVDEDGRPIIPGQNIEAMMVDGAKARKLGKKFKAGVMVPHDAHIVYDGPKKLSGLRTNLNFRSRTSMKVGQSRVMRTRLTFLEWSLAFSVSYNPNLVNPDDVERAIDTAGEVAGLGDGRPRNGRFLLKK